MSSFRYPWALCGGWAVDSWLGSQTREHGDVDFAVFDQQPLYEHLTGWQLIGHEEGKANEGADLWGGRELTPPAHLHGRPPELSGPLPERFDPSGMRVLLSEDGFWADIQLNQRSEGDWVLNREPRVTLPLAECMRDPGWGLPTVTPVVILFFKATLYVGTKNHLRPRDKGDFSALLPFVPPAQREWLRDVISQVYVGEHPWLAELAA